MSENKSEPTTSISKARTLEEIADFWDTHSLADYWDQTYEVEMTFDPSAQRSFEGDSAMNSISTNDEDRIAVYETLDEAREKFGENFGGFVFRLTREQAAALLNGKVIAFDISEREYAGFLTLAE
jgi:hypothetical protein